MSDDRRIEQRVALLGTRREARPASHVGLASDGSNANGKRLLIATERRISTDGRESQPGEFSHETLDDEQ